MLGGVYERLRFRTVQGYKRKILRTKKKPTEEKERTNCRKSKLWKVSLHEIKNTERKRKSKKNSIYWH